MLRSMVVTAAAGVVVAGAAVAGTTAHASAAPGPAAAAAATSAAVPAGTTVNATGSAAPRGPQARCARVPGAIVRTQDLEKRLAGDASTQGSLAWLQGRIDAAAAAHRTELVTVLKNRLAFRTQLAAFLPQRLALLQKAQVTVCAPRPDASATS